MIASEHVSDRRRRLAERLVVGQVILIHSVEYTPVDRLQSVADIRERTGHDDAHRIRDERVLDLMPHLYPDYLLIRELEILLFIFILVFHYNFKYLS